MKYLIVLLLISLNSSAGPLVPVNDGSAELCLALNIFHEARGESMTGQWAVANVTMNRVKSKKWPNTVCGVVYQPSQFSWTLSRVAVSKRDRVAFQRAETMAGQILRGELTLDLTEGSTYFHRVGLKPCWLTDVDKVVTIDNHVFYTVNGKSSGACL